MSTTLSFGFVKPETGDSGSVFFPALEGNIQQLNDHTHDGTDSAQLTSAAMTAVTAAIASGGWGADGAGFIQTVTMPSGQLTTEYGMIFEDDATGDRIHPTVSVASTTTYTVKVNDNTLDLTVFYV